MSDTFVVLERRLSFGTDADLYDRARPSYPAELVDDILEFVGARCRAVDVGCGTGKVAVLLAERGVRGVGIEPDPAMAAKARSNLQQFAGWRVEEADFENWEPKRYDDPFDLIVAAESWHWVNRKRGPLHAQQILREGGRLAIFGYETSGPDTPLQRAIDALYATYAPGPSVSEYAKARKWSSVGTSFGHPQRREYPVFRDYTAEEWVSNVRTGSDVRVMSPTLSEALLRELAAVINDHGGTYRHHSICKLLVVERLRAQGEHPESYEAMTN